MQYSRRCRQIILLQVDVNDRPSDEIGVENSEKPAQLGDQFSERQLEVSKFKIAPQSTLTNKYYCLFFMGSAFEASFTNLK